MPPSAPASVDVHALASRLRLSVFRLSRKLRREGDAEVTPTLLAALATIERHGPMTAGALAFHEQIRKPTCTRLIATLASQGLIQRLADPLDGRVAWVHVTPSGRKLLQAVRRRKDAYLASRFRQLTPEELSVLEQAMPILDRLMEDER
jgi:DNA-binding MarR family transcriptional regulator